MLTLLGTLDLTPQDSTTTRRGYARFLEAADKGGSFGSRSMSVRQVINMQRESTLGRHIAGGGGGGRSAGEGGGGGRVGGGKRWGEGGRMGEREEG